MCNFIIAVHILNVFPVIKHAVQYTILHFACNKRCAMQYEILHQEKAHQPCR